MNSKKVFSIERKRFTIEIDFQKSRGDSLKFLEETDSRISFFKLQLGAAFNLWELLSKTLCSSSPSDSVQKIRENGFFMLIETYSNKRGDFWTISKFQVNGWSKSIIIPAGIDSFGWFEFVNYLGSFFNRPPVFSSKNRGILPVPTKSIATPSPLIERNISSADITTSSFPEKSKELSSDFSGNSDNLWMNSLIVTRSDTKEDWSSIKNYLDMIGKTEISIRPFDNLKAIVFCKSRNIVNHFLTWEKPLIYIYTRLFCSPWTETCNNVDAPVFCHNSWIIVEGLPFSLWSESWFTRIGAKCGELLEIDEATLNFTNLHFARLRFTGLKDKTIPSKLRMQRGDEFFNVRLRNEDYLNSLPCFLREEVCAKKADILINTELDSSSPSFKYFVHGSSSKSLSPGSVSSSPENLNSKMIGLSNLAGEDDSSATLNVEPAVFSFFAKETIELFEERENHAVELNSPFQLNEEREAETALNGGSDQSGLQVLDKPIGPIEFGLKCAELSKEEENIFSSEPDFLNSLVHFPYLTLNSTNLDFDPFCYKEPIVHGPYHLLPSEASPYILFPEILSYSFASSRSSSLLEESSETETETLSAIS